MARATVAQLLKAHPQTAAGAKMATQQTFSFFDTSVATAAPKKIQPAKKLKPPCESKRQRNAPAPETPATKVIAPEVPATREAVLSQLRWRVGCVNEASAVPTPVFSTGAQAVDALLPSHGLKLDSLVEWVAETPVCGAATLAMVAAASLLSSGSATNSRVTGSQAPGSQATGSQATGPVFVIDSDGTFYPPAAIALGIPAERIVWVRPRQHAELVWAIDQALRCDAVAAVWASVGERLDDRDARRLQLAAEIGHTPGLLVRPASVRGKPSFADVRFHIAQKHAVQKQAPQNQVPQHRFTEVSRAWHVTLDRCRGASVGAGAWITMDEQAGIRSLMPDEIASFTNTKTNKPDSSNSEHYHESTSVVRLASRLADPATLGSATRGPATNSRRRA